MEEGRTEGRPPFPAAGCATVEARYPGRPGVIGLRGNVAPLSWERSAAPRASDGYRHRFDVPVPPGEIAEVKLVRGDGAWARGRNLTLHADEHLVVEPYFDRDAGQVTDLQVVGSGARALSVRVYLPPCYEEHGVRRFPVLYALDGQALWTGSGDPFGDWNLDQTLDALADLRAIDEVIVVGIDTAEDRVSRLTPTPDAAGRGGGAAAHLEAIAGVLRPWVDGRYRTLQGPAHTGLLGSSLGGLFSFFGAWTRSEVFGKAACLSGSFWWAERALVRAVRDGSCPVPRPLLYIDSGAARSELDPDVQANDGFEHSRALWRALVAHCYEPGQNVHFLAFSGSRHDATSWSARVGIPLQLLFPSHVLRSEATPSRRG